MPKGKLMWLLLAAVMIFGLLSKADISHHRKPQGPTPSAATKLVP
jgi:hypothetical protein